MDKRLHVVRWGAGQPRKRTSAANWREPIKWNARHAEFFAQQGRRRRVFCASLADVFDNEVDPDWRADLFRLIADTPNLDWLLLTKRIGNAARMIDEAMESLNGSDGERLWDFRAHPWENVWLGATIVNQEEAARDIPKLLATPAAVRFLSMEPLLGPVDLTNVAPPTVEGRKWHGIDALTPANRELRGCIDWVIVGGESGPHARPMHPDWARSLRDQCQAAGVPYLFKQHGEWAQVASESIHPEATRLPGNLCRVQISGQTDYYSAVSIEGRTRYRIERVGKKAAGRLLDGRTHDGFPEAACS